MGGPYRVPYARMVRCIAAPSIARNHVLQWLARRARVPRSSPHVYFRARGDDLQAIAVDPVLGASPSFQGNAGVAVLRTGMTPWWISTLAGVRHPHTRTYEDKRGPARI